MKKTLLIAALATLAIGTPANAQFLKKLGEAAKKAQQVRESLTGTQQQTTQSSGLSKAIRQRQSATQQQTTTTATTTTTAQPFTVDAAPFLKYVKLSATSVNLRQRPTTSSARLVYEENEMGDLSLTWTTSSRLTSGQSAVNPETLAVMSESGDWYEVAVEDYFGSQRAWVMKKFCQDITTRPLSASETLFKLISSGPYTGYFLGAEEVEGGFKLCIGKVQDGFWIVARTAFFSIDETASSTTINEGYIVFGRQYQKDYSLNLDKVIADAPLLKRIMDSCNQFERCAAYYYGIVGQQGVFCATVPTE